MWIYCLSIILTLTGASAKEYVNNLAEQYEGYGTTWMYFPDGDGKPQVMFLGKPNEDVQQRMFNKEMYIFFHLYTRQNAKEYVLLDIYDNQTLESATPLQEHALKLYDPHKETKFISHGWKSSGGSDTAINIKDGYLKNRDCNVIVVDWEELAANNWYIIPKGDTKLVGERLARLIDYLVEFTGAKTSQMHIIGHSLGAHIAGYAGSFVKSGKVARITGLDPALPGFQFLTGPSGRLDNTDATFVDVIHTCAGILGYKDPLGHVDFYPNGGEASQPGCCCFAEFLEACSHGRAHQFFAESINAKMDFMAYPCQNWGAFESNKCDTNNVIPMGDKVPHDARGVYYLKTGEHAPFALGDLFNFGAFEDLPSNNI